MLRKRKNYKIIFIYKKTFLKWLVISSMTFIVCVAFVSATTSNVNLNEYFDENINENTVAVTSSLIVRESDYKKDLFESEDIQTISSDILNSSENIKKEDSPVNENIKEQNEVSAVTDVVKENINTSSKGEEVRFEINRQRSKTKEELLRIIETNSVNDDIRQANSDLISIIESDNKESELEILISSRGYDNVVVYLDFVKLTANVLIYGNELERKDVEIIGELVSNTAGIPLHKISIIDGL